MGEESNHELDVEALQGRSAGDEPEDPYKDIDLSELPDWWREAVEEFEMHGLRPYRPPRFEDGELKHEIVTDLEDHLDITINFLGQNVRYGDDWVVQVNGEAIGTVSRRRDPAGYTVFEVDSDTFSSWIKNEID